MHKNALFLLKNCKSRPLLWGAPPPQIPLPLVTGGFVLKPPMASGDWWIRPQAPDKLSPLRIPGYVHH